MHTSWLISPLQGRRGFRPSGSPILAFAGILIAAGLLSGAQQTAPTASNTAGSQACQACHEDIYKAFQGNPHAAVDKETRYKWQGKACESCHGPGSTHASAGEGKDILNPAKMAAAEADKLCLSCHLNQPTHVGRVQGPHAKNGTSCVACHSIHHPASGQIAPRTPAAINALCTGCHTAQWAAFQRPYTHKLSQGAMSCVDCHNPHGSLLPKAIQTVSANEPGCLKCHGDKRGPFAYEHAPVRLEGCTACHEPHGSANPRMLTRQEVRLVCLECHANLPAPTPQTLPATIGTIPPAFHDLSSARYKNCTICHLKIHGSNVSGVFLR